MIAKLLTALLILALSIAMVVSADATDSIGILGHVDPGDHGKQVDKSKPGYQGKPDDHRKDHGQGTVIVTVLEPNGRPASGASVSMDGAYKGITDFRGVLTIQNVSPDDHRINADKISRYSSLRGSTQIRVRGGQTSQVRIQLRRGR